jgi:hypothetical protein
MPQVGLESAKGTSGTICKGVQLSLWYSGYLQSGGFTKSSSKYASSAALRAVKFASKMLLVQKLVHGFIRECAFFFTIGRIQVKCHGEKPLRAERVNARK